MEKKFALKAAQALKNVKLLSAKTEFSTQLNFIAATKCCEDSPVLPTVALLSR
jgi:hypothetical protein